LSSFGRDPVDIATQSGSQRRRGNRCRRRRRGGDRRRRRRRGRSRHGCGCERCGTRRAGVVWGCGFPRVGCLCYCRGIIVVAGGCDLHWTPSPFPRVRWLLRTVFTLLISPPLSSRSMERPDIPRDSRACICHMSGASHRTLRAGRDMSSSRSDCAAAGTRRLRAVEAPAWSLC
jgi:hypothetical protein